MADEYDPAYPTYDNCVEHTSKCLTQDKENLMKPEKVKSRWRRSSEMECNEKSALSPLAFEINEEVIEMKEETVSEGKENAVSAYDNSPSLNSSCNEDIKEQIPAYEALEGNLYLFERKRTKRKKEVRRMLCDCSLTKEEREKGVLGCQDECLNRLLMIECGSRCATGDACSNKRFQKRLYAKAEPFKTEKKGWGLRLLEDVPVGNFVIEYVGEILSRQDFKQRVKQYAREKTNHYYFMALKSDEIIDATNKGNLSRFMNHSCDPNCETQKWTVNGELRIGFFAKRNLAAGEELTFDYQFQRYGRQAQKCYCESSLCSGYIGVSNQIALDVNTNKVANKRKKQPEEKKREILEDLMLEEEIEKLCENGSLRNKEETLMLARLMVRAEDFHSRQKLLDIILGTTEVACLRLFLDYHGLSLLWSWMAYLTDPNLQAKILKVLLLLPVPNKTVLLDSKVFSVVEKWASLMSHAESLESVENSIETPFDKDHPKKLKSCDTSDSETDGTSSFPTSESFFAFSGTSVSDQTLLDCDAAQPNTNQHSPVNCVGSVVTSFSEQDLIINGNKIADVTPRSDEESGDMLDDEATKYNKSDVEVSTFARSLLLSWKDLKEVFRIPRREQQKHPEEYSTAESHGKEDDVNKQVNIPSINFHKYQNKDHNRLVKEKSKETFTFEEKPVERKTVTNIEERPRKVLLPTPPQLTKEERRLQFAKKVQQRDKKKALQKQQQTGDTLNFNGCTESYSFTSNSDGYAFNSSDGSYAFSVSAESYSFSAPPSNALPYDQVYFNTKSLQSPRPVLLPTPGTEHNSFNIGATQIPENAATAVYTPNVLYPPPHSQWPPSSLPGPGMHRPNKLSTSSSRISSPPAARHR